MIRALGMVRSCSARLTNAPRTTQRSLTRRCSVIAAYIFSCAYWKSANDNGWHRRPDGGSHEEGSLPVPNAGLDSNFGGGHRSKMDHWRVRIRPGKHARESDAA